MHLVLQVMFRCSNVLHHCCLVVAACCSCASDSVFYPSSLRALQIAFDSDRPNDYYDHESTNLHRNDQLLASPRSTNERTRRVHESGNDQLSNAERA